MDRAAFIEHFRIVILVEVLLKMGSRLSPDPQAEAQAAYQAFIRAGGGRPGAVILHRAVSPSS